MNMKLPKVLTQTYPKNMKLPKILTQTCPNNMKLIEIFTRNRQFKTKRGREGAVAPSPSMPLGATIPHQAKSL